MQRSTPRKNPLKALAEEVRRERIEHTVGAQILSFGPSGEGAGEAAADIDADGNIIECALFDIDRFDEGTFA